MRPVRLCKNLLSKPGSGSIITTFLIILWKLYACWHHPVVSSTRLRTPMKSLTCHYRMSQWPLDRDCPCIVVQLDQFLNYDAQVLSPCKKGAHGLSVLNRLRNILSEKCSQGSSFSVFSPVLIMPYLFGDYVSNNLNACKDASTAQHSPHCNG